VRILEPSKYGIWVLFVSLTSTLELIRTGLIRNSSINHFLSSKDFTTQSCIESASLVLNFLTSYILAGILASFSLVLAQLWNTPELPCLLIFFSVTVFTSVLYSHFETLLHAHTTFKAIFFAAVVERGIFAMMLIIMWLSDYSPTLIVLVVAKVITQLLGSIVLIIYSRSFSRLSLMIEKKWIHKLFHYGKYVMITNISSIVLRNIDIWMIGYFLGTGSVAVFSVAVRVANLYEVPSNALVPVTYPKFVIKAKHNERRGLKITFEKTVSLISACMIPAIFAILLFSQEIVSFVGGVKYLTAHKILNILILTGLFLPYSKFFGILLEADGKAWINTQLSIVYLIINAVLNYIFISYYGVMGAASATLLAYMIIFCINQYFLTKKYQVSMRAYPTSVYYYYKKFLLLIGVRLISKKN